MSILDRLEKIKKDSKIEATLLSEKFEKIQEFTATPVPALNLMLSGKYFGGFYPGVTIVAAPSKHFKTAIILLAMKAFLDKHKEGMAIFYDSEDGAAKGMFDSFAFTEEDRERILWVPILHVEDLKHHSTQFLMNDVQKGDKVFMALDSLGNLASLKEMTDADDGKTVADMSRAKQIKSWTRIILPWINKFEIPFFMSNHVIDTIEMFSKKVMTGGTGPMYIANTVIFLTKSTNKGDDGIEGFNFTMSSHKSRFIREGAKIPLTVSFEDGIDVTSGLLDIGLHLGCIEKVGHRYKRVLTDKETGEVIEDKPLFKKDIDAEWFNDMATNPHSQFIEKVEEYFSLSSNTMINVGESI